MRQRKKKRIIIFSLLGLLCIMTAGYAAFNTNLKIKGTSSVSSNWDIRITNVTTANKTGSAEEAKAPTWTELTAYMEANLYEKGDSIEYNVIVENRGTLDASLENIEEKLNAENEAIKITFSGYTKGEKLFKNSSQTIKVKIEYNPDYEGTSKEESGETSITLDYIQAEGGTVTPTDKYLVTYDCSTNGGNDCSSYNEYKAVGESINLTNTSSKEGFEFIGWNTDKDAIEALTELNMLNQNITLYAIFKDITPPECEPTIKEATVDDVTIKAGCQDNIGISEYRYSINNEAYSVSKKDTHTFNSFNISTIKVEAVDKAGNKSSFKIDSSNLESGSKIILDALEKEYNDLNSRITNHQNDLLNKTYPVGSIYITTTNTNPSSIIGGIWEAYGNGRTLVGVNTNDTNFNAVNKTGGSATNTLAIANMPSHAHSIPILSGTAASAGSHQNSIPALSGSTSSAGSHNHSIRYADNQGNISNWGVAWNTSSTSSFERGSAVTTEGAHTHTVTTTASTTGSSGAHTHSVSTKATNTGSIGNGTAFTNLQPYITVYIWKRTK